MTDIKDIALPIYAEIDDFCKFLFEIFTQQQLLGKAKIRNRKSTLSLSEIMTIVVLFHLSGYRTFKKFYIEKICKDMSSEFPKVVSYNRMTELEKFATIPLLLYMSTQRTGKVTGISFLDSTHIPVCHTKRIKQNKVFKGYAKRGKTTIGWFYGFKLHLIINDKGEIISFAITKGNVDDRDPAVIYLLTKKLFGKIFADKGYIKKDLFEQLFGNGIELITKLRRNMKGKIMSLSDRLLLRKRAIIESVNDELKNICQIVHSRHRSKINWLTNLLSGLVAYTFLPKKPTLKIYKEEIQELTLLRA